MPATFPSHAAAVLPLKLWRPRWFDGVALVIGAAVPDLVYVAGCCGPPHTYGHTWWGAVLAVPVVAVLARLARWSSPVVAAHLPGRLRDYAVLAGVRHRWWVVASSALLGAASHVAWDHITHESISGTGLGVAALAAEPLPGVPWWMIVHLASSAGGALVWFAMTVHVARHRLLLRWHGPAPELPSRPRLFWPVVATVFVVGAAVTLAGVGVDTETIVTFLPPLPRPVVIASRLMGVGALALLAGAGAYRRWAAPPPIRPGAAATGRVTRRR